VTAAPEMAGAGDDWQARRTSFGGLADVYDASRPDWPEATARWLVGADDGGPLNATAAARSLKVLDLGAGTGKLTRTLAGAGYEVVAVEPSEGMLERLRAALPGVPAHQGTAERIPLPDDCVDAVTVAQAWHWFAADAAAAECARVLRPGGVLGVGWHLRDERVPWIAELDAIVGQADRGGSTRFGDGQRAAGQQDPSGFGLPAPFAAVEAAVFGYDRVMRPEDVVALASSWSYVATRGDRDDVLERVRDLATRAAGWDGTLVMSHVTRCYRAVMSGIGA